MKLLILLVVINLSSIHANDKHFYQFCCQSKNSLKLLEKEVSYLSLKNKDEYYREKNCLNIITTASRWRIFSSLKKMKHPNCVTSLNQSVYMAKEERPCKLSIKTKSIKNASDVNINLNSRNGSATKYDQLNHFDSESFLHANSKTFSSIQINQNKVSAKCTATGNLFSVELEVGVNTNKVSNTITLGKGDIREISSMFNSQESSGKVLSTTTIGLQKNKSDQSVLYYLEVK